MTDAATEAIALYLNPQGLNRVLRCLGTERIDDVRRDLTDRHSSMAGPGYRIATAKAGIVVQDWYGSEPFKVTWNKMFAAVRAHADPLLTAELAAVCDGLCGGITPRMWAAADAILPRRLDLKEANALPYCPDGQLRDAGGDSEDHGAFICFIREDVRPTLSYEYVCETCGRPSEFAWEAGDLIPPDDRVVVDWTAPDGKVHRVVTARERVQFLTTAHPSRVVAKEVEAPPTPMVLMQMDLFDLLAQEVVPA